MRPSHAKTPAAKWNQKGINLAWRLHTPRAIDALHAVIQAQRPANDEFRRLAMGYASYRTAAERTRHKVPLESLAKAPGLEGEEYQLTIEEIVRKDLNDLKGEDLTESYVVPKQFGPSSVLSNVKTIAAMKGNAANGKLAAQRCIICHKIEGAGVSFGPHQCHTSVSIETILPPPWSCSMLCLPR